MTKKFHELSEVEKDYLFDLNGFLVLDRALARGQLEWLNQWVEAQPQDLESGTWLGNVETHTYGGSDGVNFQNVIEGGRVFEELIDHPAWINLVRRYMENDYNRVSLNENFLNIRGQGGYIGLHSGGYYPCPPMSFRHHAGHWNVGQINLLVALTDVGPGDGCTVVVPGSHKSHELHPALRPEAGEGRANSVYRTDRPDETLGAVEVHLRAGDALFFTDAIQHGGSSRTNSGKRRVLIYRYSPHALLPRYNYIPSPELLARLTPERRAIVNPVPPRLRPGRSLQGADAPVRHAVTLE